MRYCYMLAVIAGLGFPACFHPQYLPQAYLSWCHKVAIDGIFAAVAAWPMALSDPSAVIRPFSLDISAIPLTLVALAVGLVAVVTTYTVMAARGVGALGLSVTCTRWFRAIGKSGVCLALVFWVAFSYSCIHIYHRVEQQYPIANYPPMLVMAGRVFGLPERDGDVLRLQLQLVFARVYCKTSLSTSVLPSALEACGGDAAARLKRWYPRKRVRVSWRLPKDAVVNIAPGELFYALAKLKRPRGLVNFGGFDYQAWLLAHRLNATGYIKQRLTVDDFVSLSHVTPAAISGLYPGSFLSRSMDRLRFSLKNYIVNQPHLRHKPMIRALVLGDKSGVSQAQWQVFQQTGSVHMLAISGLHIGLVAAMVFWVFGKLLRPLSLWFSIGKIRLLQALICVSMCGFYAALAGFSIPTQRAFGVVLLLNIGFAFARQYAFVWLLAVAAVTVLLGDPFSFLQSGFWLSFMAVLALIYGFSGRVVWGHGIRDSRHQAAVRALFKRHVFFANRDTFGVMSRCLSSGLWVGKYTVYPLLKAQWIVFLGLAPVLLLVALPVSAVAPLANIVAVPVLSVLILPLLALALMGLMFSERVFQFFLYLADAVIDVLWQWLNACRQLTLASDLSITMPTFEMLHVPLWVFVVLTLVALLGLFAPRVAQLRLLAGCLLLAIFLPGFGANHNFARVKVGVAAIETATITVVDVGQGEALLLEVDGKVGAYDFGARYSDHFDMGSRVVLPYIMSRGMTHLDYAIVSHSDNDHAGGFWRLFSMLPVQQVYAGEVAQFLADYQRYGVFSEGARRHPFYRLAVADATGQHLGFEASTKNVSAGVAPAIPLGDCYQFNERELSSAGVSSVNVIWPLAEDLSHHTLFDKTNNRSCVLQLSVFGKTILIMGDVEAEVERYLLASGRLATNIDILIAGHHGSATSSSAAFVSHVNPRHVVFVTGFNNHYHHPSAKVVARFQDNGSHIWSTATDGAIRFNMRAGFGLGARADGLTVETARVIENRLWFDR